MKCLQCGTELDRLSKWRGSSEYCSEECKKKSQEEFNRLAMSRLMQPRPIRTSARAAAAAIRTVESSAGRLTMVTHPPGASSPLVTEPPEAGFLMDASATLAELQLRYQPPADPSLGPPRIPEPSLPSASALAALEEIVRGLRPSPRPARRLPGLWERSAERPGLLAIPVGAPPENRLPECSPVWPASLGCSFVVAGLEDLPAAPARPLVEEPAVSASELSPGSPSLPSHSPVSHRAIPSRRPARDLPALPQQMLAGECQVTAVPLSTPRLRIHLPKPALQPYRPRFAFAPKKESGEAVSNPLAPLPKRSPEREDRRSKESNRQRRAREAAQAATARDGGKGPAAAAPLPSKPAAPAARPEPAKPEVESPEVEKLAKGPGISPAPEPGSPEPAVPPAPPAAAVPKPEPERKTTAKAETQPASVPPESSAVSFAPTFGASAETGSGGFWARMPGWQKAAAAVVVVGVAVGAWAYPSLQQPPPRRAPATVATALLPENWEAIPAADTGGTARHRIIKRYPAADGKRDYVLEFTGQIDQRAMGWVFRMKDARNYYCLKLEKVGDGTAAAAQLVKFAVVDGEEQPHRLAPLREALLPGLPVKVRFSVQGQNFITEINGKQVDAWIDNQLGDGTLGFSNESGERATIRSAKVTF